MTMVSQNSEETFFLGKRIAALLQPGDIIILEGDLGAGKTCLAQGIAAALKIEETVVSPSFPIILEYQAHPPLVHMDLYRLNDIEEFILLDGERLLTNQENICLIEWGERIRELLPAHCQYIRLEVESDKRLISFSNLVSLKGLKPESCILDL